VEFVTAKKNLLWGDPKPLNHRGWVGFDEFDFAADGKRKTFVQIVKGITGFVVPGALSPVETPGLRLGDVPGLKEEAMRALRSQCGRREWSRHGGEFLVLYTLFLDAYP
jgi:hypothetical protein